MAVFCGFKLMEINIATTVFQVKLPTRSKGTNYTPKNKLEIVIREMNVLEAQHTWKSTYKIEKVDLHPKTLLKWKGTLQNPPERRRKFGKNNIYTISGFPVFLVTNLSKCHL